MVLQPSRRDVLGPPPRDASDLANIVRHLGSYSRSLDPGILDGRLRTPRPVKGEQTIVGSDGAGGDAETVTGCDTDRLGLTSLATQVWHLSYTPIAETLVVHWHPDQGAGVEWKRGEHYDLAEDDLIVTIYASALAAGGAKVGDVFSAQYLRVQGGDDDVTETVPGLATATIHGHNGGHYGTSGLPTTWALPSGTVIGDMLAVSINGIITDSRMTRVGTSFLWLGYATSLADLSVDMSGTVGLRWSIAVLSFATNAVGWSADSTVVNLLSTGDTMAVPQIGGASVTVCGTIDGHSIVDGNASKPTGYTDPNANSGPALSNAVVSLWINSIEATSPAGPLIFSGGTGHCFATVVSLIGP